MLISGMGSNSKTFYHGIYGCRTAKNITEIVDSGDGALAKFEPISVQFHPGGIPTHTDSPYDRLTSNYRRNLYGYTALDTPFIEGGAPKNLFDYLVNRLSGLAIGKNMNGFRNYAINTLTDRYKGVEDIQIKVTHAVDSKFDEKGEEWIANQLAVKFQKSMRSLMPLLTVLASRQPDQKIPFEQLQAFNLIRDGVEELVEEYRPGFWKTDLGLAILKDTSKRTAPLLRSPGDKLFSEYGGTHMTSRLNGVMSQVESNMVLAMLAHMGPEDMADFVEHVAEKARLTDKYETLRDLAILPGVSA